MPEPSAPKPTFLNKVGAEIVGTFLVSATAISVDVLYYTGEHVDAVSRWLARGFITAAVIYAFSETSGAHLDPAVTIGFALRRVFSLPMTAAYVVAQFAGSFIAAGLCMLLFGGSQLALGASHPGPGFSAPVAAATEAVLTFALMLVILMTAQEQPAVGKTAALAVGFVVATCGFAAGPISGASMNPARTIAPQILAGTFGNIWIYVVGPLVGSAIAVAVHAGLSGAPSTAERKAARGR
ncbi:MAG: aquaporin [Candidatus Eremiobacteraeota bacterium]|nr:aquaporin [Candidatus Eremiobacteraeota bacterium]